jgi:hypothetical protein
MTRAFVFIVLLLLPCAAWGQTPVAFWPLDELAGDIINDASGNNLHGTAYNAIIAQGIQGNCRSFDGFGDYLQVPDSDLLDITSRITIMFWAKTSQIDGIPIIKRVTGGDINYGVVFGKVKRSGDVLANGLYFQYEYLPCVLYGAYFEFCDDQWHHFAITLEFGNPASAKWIIDGVLRDGWWQYDTGAAGGGTELPSSNTYPLWIGGQNATSPGYWNGELDQIRIFDQALSEEEIDLIYNEERPENEYALGLLVQNASSLDAEETAAYAFATSHGFDVSLIDPAAILADVTVLDNVNAYWVTTNSEPVGFDNPAIALPLRARLEAGMGMMVNWYGGYLVDYMNLAAASLGGPWNPVVSDHQYWIEKVDSHPAFDGLWNWKPPTPPDDETKLLWYVTPGYVPISQIALNGWAMPTYTFHYAHIRTSYGWPYQNPDPNLCSQYGISCTNERGVYHSYLPEACVVKGSIIYGLSPLTGGDHWHWGPAGYKILENMLTYLSKGRFVHNVCCVATQLQAFSAACSKERLGIELTWTVSELSAEAEFFVSRAEDAAGNFSEVKDPTIEKDGLSFAFIDGTAVPGKSYIYKVEVSDEAGRRELFTTSVVEMPSLPLSLAQNHPNPFNPSTTISYYLPQSCDVRLEVFDVAGKRIAVLVEGKQDAGDRIAVWNGSNATGSAVSSGIYFYRLTAGKEAITKKMILIR